MKILKVFVFYFLLIVYSVEILLFLFLEEKTFTLDQIKKNRVEIAKKEGLNYDLRTSEQAFLEFKKYNNDLEPIFLYSPIFRFSNTFKSAKKNNNIIPFRGPINSKSITCAEDLNYKLVENDKYGFKNLNSVYENKINSMLLGDSFAEGLCENSKNDIAGHLTRYGFNTVNFGVAGTSSLVALGIMREFKNLIKPKNFIYLYYEANDLEGLNWEKKDPHLLGYLNKEYKVNYLKKYDEIKNFLELSSIESLDYLKNVNKTEEKNKKSRFEIIKNHLIDILELSKTKNIIRYNLFNKKYVEHDLDLFFSIIKKMNEEAKNFNSNFIFVYVPVSARYISVPKFSFKKEKQAMNLKVEILKKLNDMNINTIDLTSFFDKADNVKQYYPLGYIGHFNSNGYQKIAEIISEKLE